MNWRVGKKIMVVSAIFTIVFSSFTTLFIISSKNNYDNFQDKSELILEDGDIFDNVEIFPEITKYEFYDQVEVKNSHEIFNESIIPKVIKYVMENMNLPNGDLIYAYEKINDYQISFYFGWEGEVKTHYKKYLFTLKRNDI